MVERSIIFVDYQNVYHGAQRAFFNKGSSPSSGQINPLTLGETICRSRNSSTEFTQIRIYRGIPNSLKDPKGYSAALSQNTLWKEKGIEVISRPLRYPPNWPNGPVGEKPQEKGIDVALAIDFVVLALQDKYDVGILMSSDTDLRPALETVISLSGKKVEVAAWKGKRPNKRLQLPENNIWCHWLNLEAYNTCEDSHNYSQS